MAMGTSYAAYLERCPPPGWTLAATEWLGGHWITVTVRAGAQEFGLLETWVVQDREAQCWQELPLESIR